MSTYFSTQNPMHWRRFYLAAGLVLMVLGLVLPAAAQAAVTCTDTITANVVVLDNPTVFNRLGAQNPNWITYALRRDVVQAADAAAIAANPALAATQGLPEAAGGVLAAGQVELRPDKRTRPLVVRSVAGSCLTVNFTNLLAPVANPNDVQQGPAQGQPGALFNDDQVAGRCAGFHASGTEVVASLADDSSMVGNNPGANIGDSTNDPSAAVCGNLAEPGGTRIYNLHTPHEGAFVINSYGATLGSEASSGNLGIGMFGALNVEPKDAGIYRSQVTEEEMRLASMDLDPASATCGQVRTTPLGQPIIDYEALYPVADCDPVALACADGSAIGAGGPDLCLDGQAPVNTGGTGIGLGAAVWAAEGKAGLPVLNMLTAGNELVHSDINAIITGDGPNGTFTADTYPLESVGKNVPSLPNRLEPFREFTSVFHDEQTNSQVFPLWYQNPVLSYTLAGVKDQFMINYGSGGIGSEIIANRLHTGPMHDCTDCAYEEFFLASQTVGDPGMLVNFPANTMIEACDPTNILDATCWRQFAINADVNGDGNIDDGGELVGANPPIPNNFALFQEDPSNVHHAYTGDFAKIRNTHAGAFEQHIFHLHNHQWLFNPNDDNGNYLDAQEIMPGSGHTYELVNGGVGNRNKTAGDAIFHCHFYPHFAQGMWYHIRIQDTFEKGSLLAVSTLDGDNAGNADLDGDGFHDQPFALRSGQPAAGARALPDGELPDGVPIPATVPLPGKAMPMMPAKVSVVAVDRGDFGVLSGRRPAGGVLAQGPDSAQAIVDFASVAGADGTLGTFDDVNPGYPFWLAGNSCGEGAVANADPALVVCPEGTVGQRMPTPPLDMLTEDGAMDNGYAKAQAGGWDGGLPRHNLRGYTSGGLSLDTQNRLDFRKVVEIAQPVYFPEIGTDLEQVAMADHAVRTRSSFANNLVGTGTTEATLIKNGAPPVPGGPFQDPCIDDEGTTFDTDGPYYWFDGDGDPSTYTYETEASPYDSGNPRTYRIANIQIDAVFNKVGHHYPQQRIIALWGDVQDTINKQRPPEPLVMRFNSGDCGKLLHANLVPAEFEVDDFQVRTPTDIIGQHIHLPKWDLTTNDGAANGWNYEDGTLAPKIVEERIHAINRFNDFAGQDPLLTDLLVALGVTVQDDLAAVIGGHIVDLTDLAPVPTLTAAELGDPGSPSLVDRLPSDHLEAALHPFFDTEEYRGARTTIQRILVDPVVNVAGVDRGLGLTFSHDHYGPSTFQQIGLYSTILAEPAGSTWVHNETGDPLYGRTVATTDCTVNCTDGGPTTWQAVINTNDNPDVPDHREFYLEMSDFQHAYEAGVYIGAGPDGRPILNEIVQPLFGDVTTATAAPGSDLQDSWQQTVNPPLKLKSVPFPDIVTAEALCPGPAGPNPGPATNAAANVPRPCAEAINISHSSMFVVNYRNEPVGLRVFDPLGVGPDGQDGTQAAGKAGDLAFALQSRTDRKIAALNTSFGVVAPYPPAPHCDDLEDGPGDGINCDRRPGDPFTPIMRAYENDQVKIKIQVGATEEQHQATVHGMKWLANGSGFGRSPNSGWRNFQSHGISEQFSLQTPVVADNDNIGGTTDYLYATDATRDGFWTGSWGVLRTYANRRGDLVGLPNNPVIRGGGRTTVVNARDLNGVCPSSAPVKSFDVTAALANEILPNNLGVTIPQLGDIDPQFPTTTFGQQTVGGPLDPDGGTLVYNRRGTNVPDAEIVEGGVVLETLRGGDGPLNDPTAMMYVLTEDLIVRAEVGAPEECFNRRGVFDPLDNPACIVDLTGCLDPAGDFDPNMATCPRALRDDAPVEPLVLRANAGDCIEVTLRNRLPEIAPDLAGWQDMMWIVKRNIQVDPVTGNPEMHFFNNNLIRPSGYAGMHTQLVEYDMSRHDGVLVGQNDESTLADPPGLPGEETIANYRWYAGDVDVQVEVILGNRPQQDRRELTFGHTPIEFGAVNIVSADRVKQPQKGLFGALSILPEDSVVTETTEVPDGQGSGVATRLTRAQVTVNAPVPDTYPAGSGGIFRENLLVGHKITNLRWKDGTAIANIHQGELGREGAEDSGHAGFNYGMEPSWFRFMLPPDVPFGNAGTPNSYGSIPNQQAMYANLLTIGEPNAVPAIQGVSAAGDPATPVFSADAGEASRIHVLNGASADRDGTFILHGHVWARDPFVCPGENDLTLEGRCYPSLVTVDSRALGLNLQAKYMGGEEGMGHAYGYWPILFDAGGTGAVPGDYLFRDYSPSGNRNGQFGLLRVAPATP